MVIEVITDLPTLANSFLYASMIAGSILLFNRNLPDRALPPILLLGFGLAQVGALTEFPAQLFGAIGLFSDVNPQIYLFLPLLALIIALWRRASKDRSVMYVFAAWSLTAMLALTMLFHYLFVAQSMRSSAERIAQTLSIATLLDEESFEAFCSRFGANCYAQSVSTPIEGESPEVQALEALRAHFDTAGDGYFRDISLNDLGMRPYVISIIVKDGILKAAIDTKVVGQAHDHMKQMTGTALLIGYGFWFIAPYGLIIFHRKRFARRMGRQTPLRETFIPARPNKAQGE